MIRASRLFRDTLLIIASILCFAVAHSEARPHGGVPASNPACPYPVDGGCAAAPAGLFQMSQSSFGTFARQSSQTWIGGDHSWNWNQCGVDYGCGAYTADASLQNPFTNPPSGCSQFQTYILRCNSGADIEGYRFNDKNISAPGSQPVTLINNHFTIGYNTCNVSTNYVDAHGPLDAENNTFDYDETTCSQRAIFYKQTNDPGLTTNSTGTANISGTSLTYSGTPTGNVHADQYIDCPGCTEPAYITGGSGLSWTLSVSQPTLSGVTVTTGPQFPKFLAVLGGSQDLKAYYNVGILSQDLVATGGCGTTDVEYNFSLMDSGLGAHVNFVQNFPGGTGVACTAPLTREKFNTIVWSQYGGGGIANGGGTSTVGSFTTIGTANTSPSGYQVTTTAMDFSNNVLISNKTINNNGNTTAFQVRTTNQVGTAYANITWTQLSGVLTVTAVNSGGPLAADMYVGCPTVGGCGTLTLPMKILSQLTGTGGAPCPDATCDGTTGTYSITYGSGTLNSGTTAVWLYPGIVTGYTVENNYLDNTGALGGIALDNSTYPTPSQTITGNVNMITGGACTPTSC